MLLPLTPLRATVAVLAASLAGLAAGDLSAAGRWNLPSTGLQTAGCGFGAGYHAPMVLGRCWKTTAASPAVHRVAHPPHVQTGHFYGAHSVAGPLVGHDPYAPQHDLWPAGDAIGTRTEAIPAGPPIARPEIAPAPRLFAPPVLPDTP